MARSRTLLLWLVGSLGWCGAYACGEDEPPASPYQVPDGGTSAIDCTSNGETIDVAEEEPPEAECTGDERVLNCFGNWAAHCDGKKLVELRNCRLDGLTCVTHPCEDADDCDGCRKCAPGTASCGDDGELEVCKPDGSGFTHKDTCDEAGGLYCSLASATCEDLCAVAERDNSYIGCDYWAVPTMNANLLSVGQDEDLLCQPFTFAVVVANPQGVDAVVTVQSAGLPDHTVRVAPDEAKTIELPCSLALKGDGMLDAQSSVQVKGAAHHLRSNVPVTVYQFNPLEFSALVGDEKVYSYTNDASLLLPTHSLSGDYVVMALPTRKGKVVPLAAADGGVGDGGVGDGENTSPGFVAIVGAEAEPIDVEITSSAYTAASADGSIPALEPGETHTFRLAQGEVLQLASAPPEGCDDDVYSAPGARVHYCKVGKDYDLTGTRIHASGKVSVVSGHDCAFVPYNRHACDHVEETMFPLQAWGKSAYVSISEQIACQPTIPNLIRVYSDTDGNEIGFVPSEVHDRVTLDRGEYLEFEAKDDFYVLGQHAIMVAQYLLGQQYHGLGSAGSFTKGDPSLSLAVPYEQWRNRYSFLAPESFKDNFVNVIAQDSQVVLLDGRVVSGFTPIEGTQMVTARVAIAGGEHRVDSAQPVGIVVYGYAPYTSYMMPGGLDLTPINGLD